MPYERVQDLREWGFGAFEGERVSLMSAFPWGDFYVPFGGESQADVRKRVCDALTKIMSRAGHERVLAVSHGSACREFLSHWAPEGGYDRGGVPGNCSIMRFAYDDGVFSLSEVIEQDRLRELLGGSARPSRASRGDPPPCGNVRLCAAHLDAPISAT